MSIREGFEWTEVEPPVEGGERCRAEGRLAVTGKRKERQRGRMQGCGLIYRFACAYE